MNEHVIVNNFIFIRYSLATARLQKKFISEQPNEIKELMKVVKHWRNCVQWKKTKYRPNSYLLSLLVVKAVEDMKSSVNFCFFYTPFFVVLSLKNLCY